MWYYLFSCLNLNRLSDFFISPLYIYIIVRLDVMKDIRI